MVKVLDLSTVTKETTVEDGMTLVGKLAAGGSIVLGNGKYTLANVDINSDGAITVGKSGISCTGNTNIVLKGKNKVKGLGENYPGIWIKEGFTLTIEGNGSLEATGNYGAGIGCASYTQDEENNCGNIVIKSGTVTATSETAAGIGSGYSSANSDCGNITIEKDAVVTAKSGRPEAASIGTSEGSSSGRSRCESITIKSGATVTVTKNKNAEAAIGKGNGGSMGTDPVIEEGANITTIIAE
ncbi:MAG: hypothetical protein IJ205_02420 [Bacteroidales bacterium]|nr:hypothetical protein [Bacteroidales bacterium]